MRSRPKAQTGHVQDADTIFNYPPLPQRAAGETDLIPPLAVPDKGLDDFLLGIIREPQVLIHFPQSVDEYWPPALRLTNVPLWVVSLITQQRRLHTRIIEKLHLSYNYLPPNFGFGISSRVWCFSIIQICFRLLSYTFTSLGRKPRCYSRFFLRLLRLLFSSFFTFRLGGQQRPLIAPLEMPFE